MKLRSILGSARACGHDRNRSGRAHRAGSSPGAGARAGCRPGAGKGRPGACPAGAATGPGAGCSSPGTATARTAGGPPRPDGQLGVGR